MRLVVLDRLYMILEFMSAKVVKGRHPPTEIERRPVSPRSGCNRRCRSDWFRWVKVVTV